MRKNNLRGLSSKKKEYIIILVTLMIILITGSIFHNMYKELRGRVDDVNHEFENDPTILGKWVPVEFVQDKTEFDSKTIKSTADFGLKYLEFKENGVMNIDADNNQSWLSWTKGFIINKRQKTASAYFVESIDGIEYLFYEWKSGDYKYDNMEPSLYVLIRKEK